jgi:hypothetical protein
MVVMSQEFQLLVILKIINILKALLTVSAQTHLVVVLTFESYIYTV